MMKKLRIASTVLLVIALFGMFLHFGPMTFPDWFVRADGILMLASVFVLVFCSVKLRQEEKQS